MARGNLWWVLDVPDLQCERMGPYKRKEDAESCMRRVEKFYKNENDPTFFNGKE